MKKIFLIVSLALFLGAATVSAETMTTHKTIRTEHRTMAAHKGTHKKAHKKSHKNASKSISPKQGTVNQ
jgi:hypothetical protein